MLILLLLSRSISEALVMQRLSSDLHAPAETQFALLAGCLGGRCSGGGAVVSTCRSVPQHWCAHCIV